MTAVRGPNIIFLTGAPDASSLRWDEAIHEAENPTPTADGKPRSFRFPSTWSRKVGRLQGGEGIPGSSTASSGIVARPAWRSFPLEPQRLRTSLTQPTPPEPSRRKYMPTSLKRPRHLYCPRDADHEDYVLAPNKAGDEDDSNKMDEREDVTLQTSGDHEDVHSQFLEHSLALHDSMIAIASDASFSSSGSSTAPTTEESGPASPSSAARTVSPKNPPVARKSSGNTRHRRDRDGDKQARPPQFRTLVSLPPATHVRTIRPQTVSTDIVVALLSRPAPPRVVHTRRDNRPITLIELTVGDHTFSAGFGISFWLPTSTLPAGVGAGAGAVTAPAAARNSEAGRDPHGCLTDTASQLRARDIVLVHNLALAEFRGRVYGQSVRGGCTRLELLYREGGHRRHHDAEIHDGDVEDDNDNDSGEADIRAMFSERDLRRLERKQRREHDQRKDSRRGDTNVGSKRRDESLLERVHSVRRWMLQFVAPDALTSESMDGRDGHGHGHGQGTSVDPGEGRSRKRARRLPRETQE